MRRKHHSVSFACLVILALGINVSADDDLPKAKQNEVTPATFRGQPIDQWVERLRRGPVKELTQAGEEALPVWVAAVADPKSVIWVRHTMSLEFKDQDWVGPVYVAMLDLPGPLNRNMALFNLKRLPDVAQEIAPDLVKKARQWLNSGDAQTLPLIDSVIDILNKLESPPGDSIQLVADTWPHATNNTFLRRDLLELLARNGSNSISTTFEIFLKHQTPLREIQYYAKHADKRTIIRMIAESMRQTPERRRLASALIAYVADSDEPKLDPAVIVREIDRLLDDSDVHVRRYALTGARNLKGTTAAESLIPKLEKLLSDSDVTSRHAAASTLALFGPKAMPSIRRAVNSEDSGTRIVVGTAIRYMNPVPDEGIDLLLKLAEDENSKVRNYAVFNLGKTLFDDPRVVSALVHALDDRATEQWARRALAELGKNAEGAIEILQSQLQSDDIRKRLEAATALWSITKNAELVLPVALAVARDDQGITSAAYSVTYRMVDGKRVEQRKPYRYPLAARAAKLLVQMGPEAAPALDELIAMLDQENPRAKSAALRAIGEIGPAASKAIPALKKLVEETVDQQARDTLRKVQATAQKPVTTK